MVGAASVCAVPAGATGFLHGDIAQAGNAGAHEIDDAFATTEAISGAVKHWQADIARYSKNTSRVTCQHIEADYMVEGELRRLQPEGYDSIVLLCSDRLSSGEEAGARAIVGYLVLD